MNLFVMGMWVVVALTYYPDPGSAPTRMAWMYPLLLALHNLVHHVERRRMRRYRQRMDAVASKLRRMGLLR